jgi:hypothetical protein
MHMIRNATNGLWHALDIADHSAEVGMLSLTPCGGDTVSSVLGAEHDVIVERVVCRWHGDSSPEPLPGHNSCFCFPFPVADATG